MGIRYYAIDPGFPRQHGKPVYKKVQADGSFCTPGRAGDGSQGLRWTGSYWLFGGFGGPSSYDVPYTNEADTPQPPHDGWKQNKSCGMTSCPTVTML